MQDFADMKFHPESEELVNIICSKTSNTNPMFFRVHVAFYWSQLASMMRANIKTDWKGILPINMYAISLMPQGTGKGLATNFIEKNIVNQFYHTFTETTLPALAAKNLPKLAVKRAGKNQTDPDVELETLERQYEKDCGAYLITFDSGTSAAIKQARQKLLLANAGSLNLVMDEIGANLLGNLEVIHNFLELYDKGEIKDKYIKNTADNIRYEPLVGTTPTNFMGFGTPTGLLDGGRTQDEFYALLGNGYARRPLFAYAKNHHKPKVEKPMDILLAARSQQTSQFVENLSDKLGLLANSSNAHMLIEMTEQAELLFIEYKMICEERSINLPEHEELRKSELDHRYFKAMKLAGAYAFIDNQSIINEDYFNYSVAMTEMSGQAFDQILNRERSYAKLAKYLGDINRPVTQSDLVEDLPYYKGSVSHKAEMLQLATSWGYQNNVLIKKKLENGIEFIEGEALEETNLKKLVISYSTHIARGYLNEVIPFDKLSQLTNLPGYHWCSHHLINGHRSEDTAEEGFNLVVLDVEKSVSLEVAKTLLKDYTALYYTTKRHTATENRYRIILPTNYKLRLNAKDYKEFMQNVWAWLPFEVDKATGQRARKWETYNAHSEYINSENTQLLDILPFIPHTPKNETFVQKQLDSAGMDNLERWVISNSSEGKRNNLVLRYALVLVDSGLDLISCQQKIAELNAKIDKPLSDKEIENTIMVTVNKAINKRNP